MTDRDPTSPDGTESPLGLAGGKRPDLPPGPRAVYRAVLRAFATTGGPPEPAGLEAAARPFGLDSHDVLAELEAGDYLGRDGQGRIRMAYPFSVRPTPHVVAIADGPTVYSMCALDALGIPPMLGTDAVITTADPLTGTPVTVTFADGQARWDRAEAVLYAGHTGCTGPAEEVVCGYLNIFTSAASAHRWAAEHPEITGEVLDQPGAEALAAELFGALLGDSSQAPGATEGARS
ncbi:MAG TPA: alkylmercury lyase family protein [Streptosporangiaceae bacterium]|jgi:hypothetical protein